MASGTSWRVQLNLVQLRPEPLHEGRHKLPFDGDVIGQNGSARRTLHDLFSVV